MWHFSKISSRYGTAFKGLIDSFNHMWSIFHERWDFVHFCNACMYLCWSADLLLNASAEEKEVKQYTSLCSEEFTLPCYSKKEFLLTRVLIPMLLSSRWFSGEIVETFALMSQSLSYTSVGGRTWFGLLYVLSGTNATIKDESAFLVLSIVTLAISTTVAS